MSSAYQIVFHLHFPSKVLVRVFRCGPCFYYMWYANLMGSATDRVPMTASRLKASLDTLFDCQVCETACVACKVWLALASDSRSRHQRSVVSREAEMEAPRT